MNAFRIKRNRSKLCLSRHNCKLSGGGLGERTQTQHSVGENDPKINTENCRYTAIRQQYNRARLGQ